MESYAILNSRKRAIIALAHSIVFLGIAAAGLYGAPKTGLFTSQGHLFTPGRVALFVVYLVVTSVLVTLAKYSRCFKERAYFGACGASAWVGMLRALFGDPVPHLGPVARVLLLSTAVVIGIAILAVHTDLRPLPES